MHSFDFFLFAEILQYVFRITSVLNPQGRRSRDCTPKVGLSELKKKKKKNSAKNKCFLTIFT